MFSTISCLVIGIAAGDTITCVDRAQEKYNVRLAEINAPKNQQNFGTKSKFNLAKMIYYKNVEIQYETKDQDNRIIGYVTKDGQDINKQQINDGMAWFHKEYGVKNDYKMAENMAQKEKKGLWASSNHFASIASSVYQKDEKHL